MKHHHTLRNGYFSVCRGKNNLLALRFGDSTAESPGDATHVDAALTLCAEFSSPHPHASNDPPRVLSPNQNLQFLSWRMWAFFAPLIEVHRWWHAQGNAFPHTPHHCQTPAVPVLLIFGAEGGWGWGVSEEMAWFSLESLLFFSDDGVCLLFEDAAPVWLKEPRWMRHAKWCPEEKEPTEMLLHSSLPPAGNCDRGPAEDC